MSRRHQQRTQSRTCFHTRPEPTRHAHGSTTHPSKHPRIISHTLPRTKSLSWTQHHGCTPLIHCSRGVWHTCSHRPIVARSLAPAGRLLLRLFASCFRGMSGPAVFCGGISVERGHGLVNGQDGTRLLRHQPWVRDTAVMNGHSACSQTAATRNLFCFAYTNEVHNW